MQALSYKGVLGSDLCKLCGTQYTVVLGSPLCKLCSTKSYWEVEGFQAGCHVKNPKCSHVC